MSLFEYPPGRVPIVEDKIVNWTWFQWFQKLSALFSNGFSGTITTAPLTGGGTPGSITFVNGVLTAQIPAT